MRRRLFILRRSIPMTASTCKSAPVDWARSPTIKEISFTSIGPTSIDGKSAHSIAAKSSRLNTFPGRRLSLSVSATSRSAMLCVAPVSRINRRCVRGPIRPSTTIMKPRCKAKGISISAGIGFGRSCAQSEANERKQEKLRRTQSLYFTALTPTAVAVAPKLAHARVPLHRRQLASVWNVGDALVLFSQRNACQASCPSICKADKLAVSSTSIPGGVWVTSQRHCYRFGLFEVDARLGELRLDGVKTKIQEQPLQVLLKLLERPGDLVTRDELRAALWSSDTFVDFETGLNTAIKRLREVLGDSADQPKFIETLPRRGYRFIAALEGATETEKEVPPTAAHVQWRSWLVVVAVALGVLAAVAAIEIRHMRTSKAPPLEIKRITATGNVKHAAISGDGRYLAYVTIEKDRRPALWLEHLPSGTSTELLAHGPWDDILPRFSRDNNSVYLFMRLPDREEGELAVVPILGGAPRKLFEGVLSTASD